MPPEPGPPVLVVGGAAAGLSVAAALTRRGVGVTVLDRDETIGGTWARRYDRLQLHTVRRFSGLAHYPIPKGLPRYLSKDEYAAYLREYAAFFTLDVSLGEEVRAVRPAAGGRGWEVETSRGVRGAPVVVIATGHYTEPRLPEWEGLDTFGGTLLHSAEYRTGARFTGQRVLVIGLGNSGAEIAADLVECGAASVSVAVRTPPPIVTRELFGVLPVQLFGILLTPLGVPGLVDRAGAAMRRLAIGDLSEYGLGKAAWGPFSARRPAVIDAGFLAQLKARRITVQPTVERFEPGHAVYAGGAREPVDVAVAATGFGTGLERMLAVPGLLDDDGQPLFRSGSPTSAPGLYFAGFDETVRGHLYEANRDSKRLAREIERYLEGVRSAAAGSSAIRARSS